MVLRKDELEGKLVEDALLVLRGHSFAVTKSLREVAAEVVSRRLDFSE